MCYPRRAEHAVGGGVKGRGSMSGLERGQPGLMLARDQRRRKRWRSSKRSGANAALRGHGGCPRHQAGSLLTSAEERNKQTLPAVPRPRENVDSCR